MPMRLPPPKTKLQHPNRYVHRNSDDKDKDKDTNKDDEDANDGTLDEESIKKIRIMKAELALVVLTLSKRFRYKEEMGENTDVANIKTQTHEGGEVIYATPFQVCRADCIARGITRGFGFYGIMVASLYMAKVAYLKKMENGLLLYAPAMLSTFLNTINTISCLGTCDKLSK